MDGSPVLDLTELRRRSGLSAHYPASFLSLDTAALWLQPADGMKQLAIAAPLDDPLPARFTGTCHSYASDLTLKLCPLDAANASALRDLLPWLRPVPLGLTTTAGFGDRLGLATPGHVRALRAVAPASDHAVTPIFAQQSVREMERTGRAPLDVLSDATWGAFEGGWRGRVGADADHLKTAADIDAAAATGYSWYTLDPGDYVDDSADWAPRDLIQTKLEVLPWQELETDYNDLARRLADRAIQLEDREIVIDAESLARAAVKYGGAVAHVCRLYRHLAARAVPFELEISVDETETPTSHAEHVYIVSELQRLGVRWVSLAPRYIGRFEKGVDFIGDLGELQSDLDGHAAIARAFGPYKLSLHSGSDKFSVYPLIRDATRGLVHLKTAGTSYLEALRVAALVDPPFFRSILAFGCEHYDRDRVTYRVSADLNRVPNTATIPEGDLVEQLDNFDARQVLHVTFGSALMEFGPRLTALLREHEQLYGDVIARHFIRHLDPFVQRSGSELPGREA